MESYMQSVECESAEFLMIVFERCEWADEADKHWKCLKDKISVRGGVELE